MVAYEKQLEHPGALPLTLPEGEEACQGCDSEPQQNCEFVQCNKRHGTESCAFCPEYPCAMITKFSTEEWEHHQVVLNNLDRIKELGIVQWLLEMQERFSCSDCGRRTIWYQKTCTGCGTPVRNRF
jgi:hypothetical protein